jgi:NAD(P)-dependent dehydrogenase (short-subunit alcohol dehydrogenase family)
VIETEMMHELARDDAALTRLRAQLPIGRFGQPEEVAVLVRFLCVEAPAYLTGECIALRGGRL